ELLREMIQIRRFEEKTAQMYGLQKIGGFCHLYNGEEAVAVGAIKALDLKKDYVFAAYRDHGHALACGMDPKVVMAELFGKVTGCSRGKGGSMHMFDVEKHMYGGNGIVGAHIPLAAGAGLKIRYNEEDGVVLCFFGDGAIHQGSFHETLNMAKIWGLPVLFICENNQYGMGTFYQRVSSVNDFSVMGKSYDIPGKRVNGMHVLEVYEEVADSVKLAREDRNPSLLEIKTYRYKGHSMSDPAKYRKKEELDEFKEQDPIINLQKRMLDADIIDQDQVHKMDEECKKIAEEAVEFAENSDEPALETLYQDLYV
ncbi:MAG: pyruvate dehydrogenase (acetyl-transferring) E1 component subunit alpha, partial [Vulcanimicrobiota bacterium]